MRARRPGIALLAILAVLAGATVTAIVTIACACASQATAAEKTPPADGTTYLVKVTGAH